VKGVYLNLDPSTQNEDLEAFRKRENRHTEHTVVDIPQKGAVTHFWTMGNNLKKFTDLRGLDGEQLLTALAHRASAVSLPGPDGVLPADYIRRVHAFDPADVITAKIVTLLQQNFTDRP
jgi:hypothetical protein